MNQLHKDSVLRKLQALTEGPTPLLHYVKCENAHLSLHAQPWGPPIHLTWDQAAVFTKDLHIETTLTRKTVMREMGQYVKRKKA